MVNVTLVSAQLVMIVFQPPSRRKRHKEDHSSVTAKGVKRRGLLNQSAFQSDGLGFFDICAESKEPTPPAGRALYILDTKGDSGLTTTTVPTYCSSTTFTVCRLKHEFFVITQHLIS